jgi:hypothetical protein
MKGVALASSRAARDCDRARRKMKSAVVEAKVEEVAHMYTRTNDDANVTAQVLAVTTHKHEPAQRCREDQALYVRAAKRPEVINRSPGLVRMASIHKDKRQPMYKFHLHAGFAELSSQHLHNRPIVNAA